MRSTRLLDQVRERVRYTHYSLRTEKAYLYWIRFFIRWRAMQSGDMRHPREMGVADVEAFLSMLANERIGYPTSILSDLSALQNLTGIPRSRILAFACPTVYSP